MDSDDPSSTVLRLRHRIAQNLWLAVVVCLLLAAAGGFVAYDEFTAPDTTTEQRVDATWTTDSEFTHQATVQRSTRAFEAGTVLRNRSAYLTSITPELTGQHVFSHGGDAERATVTTEVDLVKRSVDPGEGGTEYWRVTDTLTTEEATIAPGESARTAFAVNVSEQRNETRQIERELGGTPGQIELYVRVTTRVTTTFEGEQSNDSRTDRLTIEPGGSSYAVTANATGQREEPLSRSTVTVPVESNPTRIYGGVTFALLCLGLAVGLVYADRRDRLALTPEAVAAMETARVRDRFDEWISVGEVSELDAAGRVVIVDSLEGLVDVAIDSDCRVIEDTTADRFVVLDGETSYVFEPAARADSERTASPETAAANGSGVSDDGAGPRDEPAEDERSS